MFDLKNKRDGDESPSLLQPNRSLSEAHPQHKLQIAPADVDVADGVRAGVGLAGLDRCAVVATTKVNTTRILETGVIKCV
jgi:hypothetical protein